MLLPALAVVRVRGGGGGRPGAPSPRGSGGELLLPALFVLLLLPSFRGDVHSPLLGRESILVSPLVVSLTSER